MIFTFWRMYATPPTYRDPENERFCSRVAVVPVFTANLSSTFLLVLVLENAHFLRFASGEKGKRVLEKS